MRRSRIHTPSLDEIAEIGRSRYADPERWPDRPGFLPPLAGAESRTENFRLYPAQLDIAAQWTAINSLPENEHYKEVRQTATEHESPEEVAPSASKGLKSPELKEKTDAWFLDALGNYLPTGATFVECLSLSIHWKLTSTGAGAGTARLVLEKSGEAGGGTLVSSENAAGTTPTWQAPVSLSEAAAKALTAKELRAETTGQGVLPFFLKTLKANKIEVFSCYVEVRIKYEPAHVPRRVYSQAVQRAASW